MIRWHPYRLSLNQPLVLPGGRVLYCREGVLLENTETGGWGDAAPLPGFSSETLPALKAVLDSPERESCGFPSLRFALECAARPFALPEVPVAVNALWMVGSEPVAAFCERIRDWQEPMVKVKPGKIPDVAALQAFVARRPDARLRIDGNRQWSVEETLRVWEGLPGDRIDYFEEPLAEIADYAQMDRRAPLPLALDESLREISPGAAAEIPGVRALVLKPTLLGNHRDRKGWISLAEEKGWTLTWSSCFESGLGLWQIAQLARGAGVAGLDTGGIFARDLIHPAPLPRDGVLDSGAADWRLNV